jgi:cold-inducible RNA-binding protein
MDTKLHIGNVAPEVTRVMLEGLFSKQGPVSDVNLVKDHATGRPRGFAFVTMATAQGAAAAIESLHGATMAGRFITVSEAHTREERQTRESPANSDRTSGRAPRRSSSRLF